MGELQDEADLGRCGHRHRDHHHRHHRRGNQEGRQRRRRLSNQTSHHQRVIGTKEKQFHSFLEYLDTCLEIRKMRIVD